MAKNKGRMLISRAKDRDQTDKKFLALSQQIVASDQEERVNTEGIPTIPADSYQNRPFTTAYGQRTLNSAHPNNYSNGRLMTRQQKFRNKRSPHSIEKGRFRGAQKINRSDRLASLDTFKTKKYSSNQAVYRENDVRGLKIADYFKGMNRLNRYVIKSKERFRRAHHQGFYKKKNTLISSYK